WHGLATARMALSQLAQATEAAQRAFELAPDSVPVCRTLMDCLTKQNRHAEAADAVASLAAESAPDHDLLLAHASALFAASRPAEAIPVFIRALALNLANPI